MSWLTSGLNVVIDNNAVNDYIPDRVCPVVDRRYHHGALRAALLTQAEKALRVSGVCSSTPKLYAKSNVAAAKGSR